jgi:hypothetical protein
MKISTVKKVLCTLSVSVLLLLGMGISTQAQHRHGPPPWAPAYGRRNARPYGLIVSARKHRRNELRRDLRLDQRRERRILNARLRNDRAINGNNRVWRNERREERRDLRVDQREEREGLRDRLKDNGNGRGGRGRH